jgi:1-hydroxycarotenoid 3,4-desaturase
LDGRGSVVVIGAGIGGLVAAFELAAHGLDVTLVERAHAPGGKMREIVIEGRGIDSGPTVLTMRWVFDRLFAAHGESLDDHVTLIPAAILARHAWAEDERLDLFADIERSAEAIGDFAGAGEAKRFRAFCERARATYRTLEGPFITSEGPTPVSLALGAGLKGLGDLWRISAFATLWNALGGYFHDPRLRQLFGRYATYCGSSPFDAPATLMLVAHVEQSGVWLVDGGMHQLAVALAKAASVRGAALRYGAHVRDILLEGSTVRGVRLASGERLEANIVIVNADVAAIANGCFGEGVQPAVSPIKPSARSLSAVTFSLLAETRGFPLTRHNVFFSRDYHREFEDIFQGRRLPDSPTVYVCAQDRGAESRNASGDGRPERLLLLVNAPPLGDVRNFEPKEIEQCKERAFGALRRCGLTVEARPEAMVVTTPRDFDRLYPATGGALYGQASHGWTASFSRPTARTKIKGLYLAGGSTHPGPGVPMAALSGRLAAAAVLKDLTSARPSPSAAMSGGMSTA